MVLLLLHLWLLSLLYGRVHSQEKTYLVMGPRMWRVGAQEPVLVQGFGHDENIPVRISLLSFPDKKIQYSSQHLELTKANNFQGMVTLQLQPKDFPRKNDPKFVFLQAQSPSFTKEERVPITHNNGFIFIQIDKPVYTPEQSVKIRIYSMDEELRPARRAVTLTFKDPEEVKMDVITQKDATGIISFPDFKIPANPKFGKWRIEATYDKDYSTSTAATFEVKEYVLPRFYVTIDPKENFISYKTFSQLSIKVKAKYYYGKNVDQAKVFIRYGLIEDGKRKMMAKSIAVQTMINGEAEFLFNSQQAVQELGYTELEELDGTFLYITTTVEETAGSLSEESEYSDVRFVLYPYTLRLIGTPLYVKPTLPYHIKVRVKDTLDQPVSRIPLTLTGNLVQDGGEVTPIEEQQSLTQQTDNHGIAVFVVNIPADVTALDFKISTNDKNLPEENQASSSHTATAYKSPTKSYLYINWAREREVLQVGDFLNVQVVPSSPYLPKLTHYSYLVISRGKIVTFDTVQRVHESTSQNLNIQITSPMVPSIRLLVYYIITGETTAEVVADSIWVDVSEKCINNQKVLLSAVGSEFKPKASLPLTIRAPGGSIVGLSAVDVSVYDVTKKAPKTMERVLRRIEQSDLGCGAGAGKDNVDVFELAGLTFITNANIRASQNPDLTCDEILRSKRSIDLDAEIQKMADKTPNKRLKKCCIDGGAAFREDGECEAGVERVKKQRAKQCVDAFRTCCEMAKNLTAQLTEKHLDMGRM
ncbi:complement C5-like, partial [Engystomops pustulosus]|uniref:complement C5-like n=1 Tax=Engystomops pustulosus TaxID=76066 RepID=UPI003AFAABF8